MAPTPTTIPTSFVPKQPVRVGTHFTQTGGNTFLILSLLILGIAILASGAVFGYEQYLMSVRETKSAEVKKAQENIDIATVEEFIHTRDRFKAAKGVLDSHVVASNFFDLLESLTLQNVRFSSLGFTVTEDRSAQINMSGTARTFNALAAQSSVFAGEKRIKRAIFSDIRINDNKSVSFSLEADLDPKLLTLLPEVAQTVPADDGALTPPPATTTAAQTGTATTTP